MKIFSTQSLLKHSLFTKSFIYTIFFEFVQKNCKFICYSFMAGNFNIIYFQTCPIIPRLTSESWCSVDYILYILYIDVIYYTFGVSLTAWKTQLDNLFDHFINYNRLHIFYFSYIFTSQFFIFFRSKFYFFLREKNNYYNLLSIFHIRI